MGVRLVLADQHAALALDPGMSAEASVRPRDSDVQFRRVAMRRQKALQSQRRRKASSAGHSSRRRTDGPGHPFDRTAAVALSLRPGPQSLEREDAQGKPQRRQVGDGMDEQQQIAAR
jgi:hypothetical protein